MTQIFTVMIAELTAKKARHTLVMILVTQSAEKITLVKIAQSSANPPLIIRMVFTLVLQPEKRYVARTTLVQIALRLAQ